MSTRKSYYLAWPTMALPSAGHEQLYAPATWHKGNLLGMILMSEHVLWLCCLEELRPTPCS